MPQSLLRFIIESESKHARINCKWGNESIEISRKVLSGLGDADALRTAGEDLSNPGGKCVESGLHFPWHGFDGKDPSQGAMNYCLHYDVFEIWRIGDQVSK
jgi:hypothetical protein